MAYRNHNFQGRLANAFFKTASDLGAEVYLDSGQQPYFFHRSIPSLLAPDHGKPRVLMVKLMGLNVLEDTQKFRHHTCGVEHLVTYFGMADALCTELLKGCKDPKPRYQVNTMDTPPGRHLRHDVYDTATDRHLMTLVEMP